MTDWTDLEPRLAPERSAQLRAGLLTEITRRPARARSRFTGIVITAAAALTVAGTTAAWVAMTRPDDPTRATAPPASPWIPTCGAPTGWSPPWTPEATATPSKAWKPAQQPGGWAS